MPCIGRALVVGRGARGAAMSRALQGSEYTDLDDFEELLLEKPPDEKWELISGRVVRDMVGGAWRITGSFRTSISPCALTSGRRACLGRPSPKRSGSNSGS